MDNLEEIKSKIDIVSFISEYLKLSRAGRNFKALCPFHQEKTPSFVVSPELGIWRCFGACGEGGDIFKFLMKIESMDFPESVRFLAQKAGVQLTSRFAPKTSEKEHLYQLNQEAVKLYHYLLTRHRAGQTALSYLKRDRGLDDETINRFELGFAPLESSALVKFLINKRGWKSESLLNAGLVVRSGEKLIDRFHGRLIFPLKDERGNAVGFSGRLLPLDEGKTMAKYINTPETLVYQKRRHLFGLSETKEEIKKEKLVVVVEGEFDLLSCWRAGIKNMAAIKGTAFTEEQVKLLSRFTNEAVLALDSDAAGEQATKLGILLAERHGLDIRVATLGAFKDPDELVRADPQKFKQKMASAMPAYDFFLERSFAKFNPHNASGIAQISRELVPIISAIDDRIVQDHYIKVIAEKLRLSQEAVAAEVTKIVGKDNKQLIAKKELPDQPKNRREMIEEHLAALAFQQDPQFLLREEVVEIMHSPLIARIIKELDKFLRENDKFNPANFIKVMPAELVDGVTKLMLAEVMTKANNLSDKNELEHSRLDLLKLDITERIEKLSELIKIKEKRGENARVEEEELTRLVGNLARIEL